MTSRVFLFLLITAGIGLLTSCNNKKVFESYSAVPRDGWQKDSVYTYTASIKESARNYNLYFNIRNSVDYSYSNIWLFLTISPPKGEVQTETVEFVLADRAGKWFGNGHGKFRDNKLICRRNIYFPIPGDYVFKIQQGMRTEKLQGISDVGIMLEKVN